MTNPPLLQPNLAAFWQAFLNQAGLPPSTPCADVYAFGSGAAMADELLALVLAGKKKATCGCLRSFELGGLPLPRVGDLCLVLDGRGNPTCVLRTLAVQVPPPDMSATVRTSMPKPTLKFQPSTVLKAAISVWRSLVIFTKTLIYSNNGNKSNG